MLDLLGLLAYASLTGFFRLSEAAVLAVALADKTAMAEMAVAEYGHFRLLRQRLSELTADPGAAMAPFVTAIDDFHARTVPADWHESLVKAYVGDGIVADFYRAIAGRLDPPTRSLVLTVLADAGHGEFTIARIRAAIDADPSLAGRLALWARRLVGEALGQVRRMAATRPPLAALVAGGTPVSAAPPDGTQADGTRAGQAAAQLGDVGRIFARLTDAHAYRMLALGLAQ